MYALVTGASRGIGRAIAMRLAQDGFQVIINYRSNDAEAEHTLAAIQEAGGQAELLKFDVSDAEAVEQNLTAWQAAHPDDYIAVLVNNAGVRKDELMVFLGNEDFENVLKTNLFSFFYVTKALVPTMIRHRFGRIVNMASLSGLKGLPGQTNYSASKGGLIAATKALAQEVAKKKITVNAVAPGFVKTDMVDGLPEDQLKMMIPAGRFGEPEEVASLVSFLCSKQASYITGECININGGLYS
ncbi:MAG: 3-oxoacyl-ACP reductase FabG [Paludibacteraceae bacterium]|nr:3-oxoacyl-ACP reductase FabG [Paludibacteraceae bacterium]